MILVDSLFLRGKWLEGIALVQTIHSRIKHVVISSVFPFSSVVARLLRRLLRGGRRWVTRHLPLRKDLAFIEARYGSRCVRSSSAQLLIALLACSVAALLAFIVVSHYTIYRMAYACLQLCLLFLFLSLGSTELLAGGAPGNSRAHSSCDFVGKQRAATGRCAEG